MSDADRVALRYAEESAFGVTPDGELLAKTTVSVSDVDDSYNDAVEDLSVFKAGQLIVVSGFTEAANNGVKTVVSATEGKMIVEESLTTEALGDTVSIKTVLQELRFTGESLRQESSFVESKEIRDDRQVADVVRAAIRAAGGINFEFSYGAYDDLLRALLMSSSWSTEVEDTQITFSMDDGDNSINDSGSGFVTAGFAANQWVEIRGFTTAANNGYFKIVSVAAGKMVLSGGTVVTEAAGDSVTITMAPQIVNGTTEVSFSMEREFEDLTDVFTLLIGLMPASMRLEVNAEQIITGSFDFMGKSEASATASTATGTPEAAPTNEVMSAVEDVLDILENMASIDASAFTLEVTNNLREKKEIANLGPTGMGKGKIAVSGTLQMYFEAKTQMDKYRGGTETSLVFLFEDGDGNAYIVDLPRVKLTAGQQAAGGENTDVIADMSFAAYRDATEDVTIRIVKIDA